MPDPLGRACIFPGDDKDSVTVVDVCIIRTSTEAIDHKWLMHWINSPAFRSKIGALQSGTTRRRISRKNLASITFPIPPTRTQLLIREKIEELFSHIDAGVEGLKQAKSKLQQYRQSVLKDAVTGELTREWREQNADQAEPADQLLTRILKERRAHWEAQQLKVFEEKGKLPKNDKWKDKYKEPSLPATSPDIKLPDEWKHVTTEIIFKTVTDGDHQAPPKVEKGIPFLVIGDVNSGEIKFRNNRFVPLDYYNNIKEDRKPMSGDLLYTVVGSFGIPVKVDTEKPFCVQRHIAILKPSSNIDRDFYFYALKSGFVFSQAAKVATGTAQKTVPLGGLRAISLPLPSFSEQKVIASIVSEKLEISKRTELAIDDRIRNASSLKSSILAKAFNGTLVKNETDGPSASGLLKEIEKEKALLTAKTRLSRKKPAKRVVKMPKRPIIEVLKESKSELTVDELFDLSGHQKDISSESVELFYQELKEVVSDEHVIVREYKLNDKKQGDKFSYKDVL